MEQFSKPGVGGIIERMIDDVPYILIQERYKDDAPLENGMIEIPVGKIREYENVYDCLRREIKEETGLDVVEIKGEAESTVYEANGYQVLNYEPFSCSQNIKGYYPIMVHVFICKAEGTLLKKTNETQNLKWVSLAELSEQLKRSENRFYPMHVLTLKKYLKLKNYQ